MKKLPARDILIPVLLVCFVFPLAAGIWFRYFSGHAPAKAAPRVERPAPPVVAQLER